MLEQNDLQAIGILLDQKLKVQDEKLDQKLKVQDEKLDQKLKVQEGRLGKKFDEKIDQKFDEMISAVNDGFTGIQEEINGLKKEMANRPTKAEIFSWADRRIVDLELAKDRHDYMHIDDLDKLPPQADISRALAERGFKQKIV